LNTNYMKALKEKQGIKFFIKSSFIALAILLTSVCCKAQEQLDFPFQGGSTVMTQFFKDSVTISPEIIQKKAIGVAIFKFTADVNGNIKKIIIYYADDYVLTPPLIEALKKSNHKWVIPNHEKQHDFIIQLSVYFNPPATGSKIIAAEFYKFYTHRRPILALNQVPVDNTTLLPTVVVNYDLP